MDQQTVARFKNREVKATDIFRIVPITKRDAYGFVKKYHYLGGAKFFSEYAYGLFFGHELVGCATFAAPQGRDTVKGWFGLQGNDKSVMELTRLCMLPSLNGTNATSFLLGGGDTEVKAFRSAGGHNACRV